MIRKEMSAEDINRMLGKTEEELERECEEYENDTWEGGLGPIFPGRPRLYDEELEAITVKLPTSWVGAIDARAKARGRNRSQILRELVLNGLLSSEESQSAESAE